MTSPVQLMLASDDRTRVQEALAHFWGFGTLRPLQEAAIAAAAQGRDSLVVMPTGGGKSLCFQIPPLLSGGTDVVVSPLIALMKDQVDGLRERGYPAAALHSGLTSEERTAVERDLAAGSLRLIFGAPERLLTEPFLRQLARLGVRRFAIDEAHCISHWGHDFRPEYRRLAELRARFPHASIHGFTATATERVREDILQQLQLRNPAVLVGSFDRPNLVYRVVPRADVYTQALQVIRRHKEEAAIVYCLSRRETEEMAAHFRLKRVSAAAYHAGMEAQARRGVQDAFAAERLDVVVATIAFGMGIDRSNVRCVVHTCIPKSIEHYQQETGRAGRDGLEAECVLFYSAADVMRWESLMRKNAAQGEVSPEAIAAATELLRHMQRFCNTPHCRHRALVNYFGQSYEATNCKACDACLGEIKGVMEATVLAQKILSCVARVKEGFGITHVLDVLLGAGTERVRQYGHDRLSTYGLLADIPRKVLTNLVYQLVDQELLLRTPGDRPILKLNNGSWEVMRGRRQVKLLEPQVEIKEMTSSVEGWAGVDRGLFEHLRSVRRAIAEERSVPAFIVLGDATLRQMARVRPTSVDAFGGLPGVGAKKTADLGLRFIREVEDYCRRHNLPMDQTTADSAMEDAAEGTLKGPRRRRVPKEAAGHFRAGRSIQQVMAATGRKEGTVCEYLAAFILQDRPRSIEAWVNPDLYREVAAAIGKEPIARLRPIYDRLNGQVSFHTIRLVLAHRAALKSDAGSDGGAL